MSLKASRRALLPQVQVQAPRPVAPPAAPEVLAVPRPPPLASGRDDVSPGPITLHLTASQLEERQGRADFAHALGFLRRHPEVSDSLRLFEGLGELYPSPEQRKVLARRLFRQLLINHGHPAAFLGDATPEQALLTVADYARDLGFRDVTRQGDELRLHLHAGRPLSLGEVGKGAGSTQEWIQQVGRRVNRHRFGMDTVLPPRAPAKVRSPRFESLNAHWAAHLSRLAYEKKATVRAQLEAWGFDPTTFHWIDDGSSRTDTEGFVVADRLGNIFVAFRGTSSRVDALNDAKFTGKSPHWSPRRVLFMHSGIERCLDSVWWETWSAVEKLRAQLGKDAPMFFTGHSLGGALAQLAAYRATVEERLKGDNAQVYTLGAPRIFNHRGRSHYQTLLPQTYRLVNFSEGGRDLAARRPHGFRLSRQGRLGPARDAVTHLPPKYLGYHHAGSMVMMQDNGYRVVPLRSRRFGPSPVVEASAPDPLLAVDPVLEEGDHSPGSAIEQLAPEELHRFILELGSLVPEGPTGTASRTTAPVVPEEWDHIGRSQSSFTEKILHASSAYLYRTSKATLKEAAEASRSA